MSPRTKVRPGLGGLAFVFSQCKNNRAIPVRSSRWQICISSYNCYYFNFPDLNVKNLSKILSHTERGLIYE